MTNSKTVWKWVISILLLVLIVFLIFKSGIINDSDLNKQKVLDKYKVEKIKNPVTIPQRMAEWQEEQQKAKNFDLYLSLSPIVFETILKRIGASATYEEIVEEYQRNKNYYISKQISIKTGEIEIDGPDANNIEQITITTKLKEKKPSNTKKIEITPIDSITD